MCLALFASSALAAPAPQESIKLNAKGPQDTSALVDTILGQLDGSINAAIQAALNGPTIGEKITITPSAFGGAPVVQDKFILENPYILENPPTLTNFQGTFSQVNKPSKNLWNQRILFLCCRAPP